VPAAKPVYMYNGRRFATLQELQDALRDMGVVPAHRQSNQDKVGRSSAKTQLQYIRDLLEDTAKYDQLVGSLFGQYAGADRRLQQQEAMWLMMSLGAQIGVSDPMRTFGEVKEMFYRFDFSGTGTLDEAACKQLCKFILRKVRDRLDPPHGVRVCRLPWKSLCSEYDIISRLGQGGQGAVYLAEMKKSSSGSKASQRVVKFYSKADANAPLDDIKEEFGLLKRLDHPLIARVNDIFEDNANIYVVSEPYLGGDLTTLLAKAREHGVVPDAVWVGKVLKQVVEGVAYLHSEMVMHCDLKEPNIMVSNNSAWHAPHIVIIDFGMAKDFSGTRKGGTPGYMPPEVWQINLWTPKGDIFSLAVVFWSLFNGRPGGPFYVADAPPYTRIRMETINRAMDCSALPLGLRELTGRMALKDFLQRPTAKEALASPFFKNLDRNEMSTPLNTESLDALKRAADKRNIQNLLAADLASTENFGQLAHLNTLFERLDANRDGRVQECEARVAFARLGITSEQSDRLIAALMCEGGMVHYSEFMAKVLIAQRGVCEERLADLFAKIDTDGSGTLSRHEIQQLLAWPGVSRLVGGRSADSILQEMDWDHDGTVSFEEFRCAMLGELAHLAQKTAWRKGDVGRYFSKTKNAWIPCTVLAVNPKTGAVVLDIKPGVQMPVHVQQALLARGSQPPVEGAQCRYYSPTRERLVDCKVKGVDAAAGTVEVDSRPHQKIPAWAVYVPHKNRANHHALCAAGHELRRYSAPVNGFMCDECKLPLQSEADMWTCQACNYGICGKCIAARHAGPEVGTDDHDASRTVVNYKAEVVRDYVAEDDSQLSLCAGETVYVEEENPSGWLAGYKEGTAGPNAWFPSACVRPIKGANASQSRQSPDKMPIEACNHVTQKLEASSVCEASNHATQKSEASNVCEAARHDDSKALETFSKSTVRGRRSVATPCAASRIAESQAEVSRLQDSLKHCEGELLEVQTELLEERNCRHRSEEKVKECMSALEATKEALRAELAERGARLESAESHCLYELERRLEAERQIEVLRAELAESRESIEEELKRREQEFTRRAETSRQADSPSFVPMPFRGAAPESTSTVDMGESSSSFAGVGAGRGRAAERPQTNSSVETVTARCPRDMAHFCSARSLASERMEIARSGSELRVPSSGSVRALVRQLEQNFRAGSASSVHTSARQPRSGCRTWTPPGSYCSSLTVSVPPLDLSHATAPLTKVSSEEAPPSGVASTMGLSPLLPVSPRPAPTSWPARRPWVQTN